MQTLSRVSQCRSGRGILAEGTARMDPGHVVCSGNWKKTRRGAIKVKLERKRREQVTQNTAGFRKFRKQWKAFEGF